MRRLVLALGVCLGVGVSAGLAQAPAGKDLFWAFPTAAAVINKPPSPTAEGPQHIPGSAATFTQAQIDRTAPAVDWFPDQHPPMPSVVRDGSTNGGFACASCHSASGRGHPESADLTGLTPDYFIKTMAELRSGVRKDPIRMTAIAKATSDEDVREAAKWFASLQTGGPGGSTVVESATVPKTYIGPGRMRFVDPGDAGREPIGPRIITVPQDVARVQLRDPRIGFIAYVPPGSLTKGKALAAGVGGKTLPCAACHGAGLKGLGNVPSIAGNHPIYLARQLYNFQSGARDGPDAQLMKGVVAQLTDADIVALSAYLGSLPR